MKVVEKKLVDETPGKTEGARRATGVFSGEEATARPLVAAVADTEVVAKAQRRRFTAEYKQQIIREADRCAGAGEIGALLRREGLYSSHLSTWRAARDRGALNGLAPKKRGPKATVPDARDKKIAEQERAMVRWQHRAERAEALVELQKKIAALLGTPVDTERS
jgi:transposase-like protein